MKKIFICFLSAFLVTIFLGCFNCNAEQLSENALNENVQVNVFEDTINISNLKNAYCNSCVKQRQPIDSYVRNLLVENGVNGAMVSNLSDSIISKLSNTKSITISKSRSFWGDDVVVDPGESVSYGNGDFEIYSVLLNYGDTVVQNGITYMVYETQVWATWSTVPIYRLTDTLALCASNGVVYGPSSERFGIAVLYYYSQYGNYSHEYSLYDNDDNKNILSEYSDWNFAMNIDLPYNKYDVNGNALEYYQSMFFFLGTTLYAKEAFNVYSAYGHKYLWGAATITSPQGFSITFEDATYNYSGTMLSSISRD